MEGKHTKVQRLNTPVKVRNTYFINQEGKAMWLLLIINESKQVI